MLGEQAMVRRREEQRLQLRMAEMKQQWMDDRDFRQTRGIVCPYKLIGRRHNGCECECENLRTLNIYDHPYGFYRNGRAGILECIVAHPYQYYGHEIDRLERICAMLGLRYEIHPKLESWCRQGSTFIVVITDDSIDLLDFPGRTER